MLCKVLLKSIIVFIGIFICSCSTFLPGTTQNEISYPIELLFRGISNYDSFREPYKIQKYDSSGLIDGDFDTLQYVFDGFDTLTAVYFYPSHIEITTASSAVFYFDNDELGYRINIDPGENSYTFYNENDTLIGYEQSSLSFNTIRFTQGTYMLWTLINDSTFTYEVYIGNADLKAKLDTIGSKQIYVKACRATYGIWEVY